MGWCLDDSGCYKASAGCAAQCSGSVSLLYRFDTQLYPLSSVLPNVSFLCLLKWSTVGVVPDEGQSLQARGFRGTSWRSGSHWTWVVPSLSGSCAAKWSVFILIALVLHTSCHYFHFKLNCSAVSLEPGSASGNWYWQDRCYLMSWDDLSLVSAKHPVCVSSFNNISMHQKIGVCCKKPFWIKTCIGSCVLWW